MPVSDYQYYLEKLTKNILVHHKSDGLKNRKTLVAGSKCNLASPNLYQYKPVLNRQGRDMSQERCTCLAYLCTKIYSLVSHMDAQGVRMDISVSIKIVQTHHS